MCGDSHENRELSASDERRLVEWLDEFEQAHRRGQSPRIEEFVARADARLRDSLLGDLIRVQQELADPNAPPPRRGQSAGLPRQGSVIRWALSLASAPSTGVNESTIAWPEAKSVVEPIREPRPSLMAETAEMLRTRLLVLALIVAVGLGIFLFRAAISPRPTLLWLRAIAFLIALACCWRLGIARARLNDPWRLLELVLILIFGIQTVALQIVDMLAGAARHDAVQVNTAMLFAYASWSVACMAYAIIVPNPWRRAAMVLVPAATLPLVVTLVLVSTHPPLASAVRRDSMYAGALLTYLAAGAAIAGTYTVHSLRRQLYMARRFGSYRLTRRLGHGGMGEVYLAEHERLKRPSAIKLIRPGFDTSAEVVERFEREVQATARLSHWNTVEIFDYGRTEDGAFYYVMEYLDGLSLQELVDQFGPLPPERVIFFLRQICDCLTEAHQCGLIHQDIKPANIFAARRGSRCDVAKLLDFGLVHEVAPAHDAAPRAGQETMIVGTPRFMSPEQAAGRTPPGVGSDIYSLGATAFYLLTSRPVFDHDSVAAILRAHREEALDPAPLRRAQVPADLAAVVVQCLAKDPRERYRDAAELNAAFQRCESSGKWSNERASAWWSQLGNHAPAPYPRSR